MSLFSDKQIDSWERTIAIVALLAGVGLVAVILLIVGLVVVWLR